MALLWALLALGLGLRLWTVPYARFTGDESSFWDSARALAALERFPVLGPEVTGSPARLPGPAFHYITALPQLFGSSPWWGSVFMVLLHGLAGLAFADFARRTARGGASEAQSSGLPAAAVALALWSVAPWDVLYGDRVWASCLAPALGAFALWAVSRESPRGLALAAFLCGLMPQIHLSAPILWAAVLGFLLFRRPPGVRLAAARGLGAAGLTYLPFIILELRSGFANTRALLAHSGGGAAAPDLISIPLKVIGYAVLYASGEMSYQFERGYWGGGFDEASAYLTAEGWQAWWSGHGSLLGALVLWSVVLASLGWGLGLGRTFGALRMPHPQRASTEIPSGPAMTLAVGCGLLAGAALMMGSRKAFFPHYANILVPFALWPAVYGLEVWVRRRPRLGGVAIAAAMLGMGMNTVRYYRNVDGLNGLGPTLGMVEKTLALSGPVALRFTHFNNSYAWAKLAAGHFGQPLRLDGASPHQVIVHNRNARKTPLPPEGRGFGPAWLETRPARPLAPPGARFVASTAWRSARVETSGSPKLTGCPPELRPCRYGPNPWQRLAPEPMRFGGRMLPVLFLHPATSATVAVAFEIPPGPATGTLVFGLTDAALASTNRAPVSVTLRQGDAPLLRTRTATTPGLSRHVFDVDPTRAGSLALEITTENDGARVFGFDLWLR